LSLPRVEALDRIGTVPLTVTVAATWCKVFVHFELLSLYSGEQNRYPLNWNWKLVWTFWIRAKYLSAPGLYIDLHACKTGEELLSYFDAPCSMLLVTTKRRILYLLIDA
jgi:hypothetical protein